MEKIKEITLILYTGNKYKYGQEKKEHIFLMVLIADINIVPNYKRFSKWTHNEMVIATTGKQLWLLSFHKMSFTFSSLFFPR